MAGDAARWDTGSRAFAADEPPEMVFEIRLVTGAEAQRLRLAQAEVLREVIEWVAAQKLFERGQDRAA
jgi:hypothetical protein